MQISKYIITKWLEAWSLSRDLPLPIAYKSGFRIDTDSENEKCRYIFPELNADFIQLAADINEPLVLLKTLASPKEIKEKLPLKWTVQPQGYMMLCFNAMAVPQYALNSRYIWELKTSHHASVLRILTLNGEPAAEGRLIVMDDLAVYDRIKTHPVHQRQGLASLLMGELERIALSQGVYKNVLVATEQGKSLYESIGWELDALYTTVAIIP